MEKIKKGDIVILKSGGPKMTAGDFETNLFSKKNNEDKILCIWFNGNEKMSEYFDVTALVKA
jgi:uncharacterized protein YodC (DUF2158 family)